MSDWMQRFGGLFGGRPAAMPPHAPQPRLPKARPTASQSPIVSLTTPQMAAADSEAAFDLDTAFFEWLIDAGPTLDLPLSDAERKLLVRLDDLIADTASHAALLPRATSIIPQLMSCLRDEHLSEDALAKRITKDAHLVAETIRLANGAASRSSEPVSNLPEAIKRLGIVGLQRVIARVLLKPIFNAHSDTLSARAAPRLWMHSEAQAEHAMRLAADAGLDAFDGYLAGLMHNVGWTAALRAIDGGVGGVSSTRTVAPLRCSSAFVHALAPRRERLFASLVKPWGLSPAISALAVETIDSVPPAQCGLLGNVLIEADKLATLQVLGIAAPAALTGDA